MKKILTFNALDLIEYEIEQIKEPFPKHNTIIFNIPAVGKLEGTYTYDFTINYKVVNIVIDTKSRKYAYLKMFILINDILVLETNYE